jgi:hypothetical protein
MLDRLVEERMRFADAGVADHDIEATEFLDCARDQQRDLARFADVGPLRERAGAARGDAFARCLGGLDIEVRQNERGAVRCEPFRDGEP